MIENTNDIGSIVARRKAHLARRPEAARYTPKVTSRLVRNLRTETAVRTHSVISDYVKPAGGDDTGANPIELLLAALAACIEAAFHEFATHEGLKITSVEADVQGRLDLRGLFMVDENVPPGFEEITYTLRVRTLDDPDRVRALAEKVILHCPVVDSLVRAIPVSGTVDVEAAENPES